MDALLENIICLIGSKHGAKKELADYLGISQNVLLHGLLGKASPILNTPPRLPITMACRLIGCAGIQMINV